MAAGSDLVDEYLAAQPEASRPALAEVRAAIRRALPAAEEVISYRIPAYRLDGRVVIFFAGWKKHWSLYPVTEKTVAALGGALDGYAQSKGTVRFPLGEPVPVALVERIARHRAAEMAGG